MAGIQIAIMDADDDVWWEMPESMVDRLMQADTTVELAQIARVIKDQARYADEKISENLRRASGKTET